MIKLSNNSFVSPTSNDVHDVISLGSLEEKLQLACKSSGYPNSNLSHDILSTVMDYILWCHETHKPLTLAELEKLVFRILWDTGLYEVANKFSSNDKIFSPNYDIRFINPDRVSIGHILSQNPIFRNKPIDGICDFLLEKLSKLGLEKITDKLLIALAENISINLCLNNDKGEQKFHGVSHSSIMSHSEIRALLNEDEIRLIQDKIVKLRPISLLLPIIKVRVFVQHLLEITNELFLLELKLYPAFNEVCSRLKNITKKLVTHLHKKNFLLADNTYKIEILFDIRTGHSTTKNTTVCSSITQQISDLNKIASYHFHKGYLARYSFI